MTGLNSAMNEMLQYIRTMPVLELLAVISSLLYTVLAAKEKISCWFFGLIGSVLYVYLCLNAKLYQDAGISFYYAVMAIYGWLTWKGLLTRKRDKLSVRAMPLHVLAPLLLMAALLSLASGLLFARYTDASLPYMDAAVTMFAFLATWMQARKLVQNWLIFAVVDFVSIFMYGMKGMYFTSLLFIIYTIISLIAWRKWSQQIRISAASLS